MDFIKSIQGIDFFIQLALLVLVFVYFIFAFLVVRQTSMLNKGFETDAAVFLKFLALAHFLGTGILLVFTGVTLFF